MTPKQMCLMLVAVLVISHSVCATPVTVTFTEVNTSRFGYIGTNDPTDTPTSFHITLSPDAEYLHANRFGFGHNNRIHLIKYFDLSSIINTRQPGHFFSVADSFFSMSENESLQYTGPAEIHPILVDWVTHVTAGATWNDIELSGRGSPGHGTEVQNGGRINNTTYRSGEQKQVENAN